MIFVNSEKRILDLGCGPNKVNGALGVDIVPMKGVDVVANFFELIYPFADNTFDEIHLVDVIEHLPNTIKTMEEIHRIARPDAKIFIRVVNWNSIYTAMDPTHVKAFTEESFDFYGSRPGRNYYTKARFEVVHVDRLYNPQVQKFIHSKRIMKAMSYYLCNVLLSLDFELRVIKPLIPANKCLCETGETVFSHIRCPHCVSGKFRQNSPDPGKLDLYKNKWLICREPGCGRKYPVIDGLPIMINEEGELYCGISRDELPEPPREKYTIVPND